VRLGGLLLVCWVQNVCSFLGPEDSQTECFAVSFYAYQLLLLPATVLSLVAFAWLTRRQHNTALLLIIIPFLFV